MRFPERLTFEAGCRVVEQIAALPDAGRDVLDLSAMRWVEPFAMLHVASAVGRKLSACPALELRAVGQDNNGYARFMGFHRELGIGDAAEVAPPPNHENYLPIRAINLRHVRAEAERRGVARGQIIEEHSRGIARALARTNYGALFDTVQYALREIIRNAAEHSRSDHVLYCGQYWPTRRCVEVAILDEGVGIVQSLRRNPHLGAASESDLLSLSLEPGVSGAAFEGAEIDERDAWSNSGFGLYVVSELCRRGGSFTLVSGQAALCVSETKSDLLTGSHAGTALRLIIDTERLRSIAASLALIVAEGERRAARHRLGPILASTASKTTFS